MLGRERSELENSGERILRDIGGGRALPVPRVHGNGFVQLDLDKSGSKRLHIWGHPLIPQQSVSTGVHDHTYDVLSTVLTGAILNFRWSTCVADADESTHRVYTAVPRDGADTELVPTDKWMIALVHKVGMHGENSESKTYEVGAGAFHSTGTIGPAATLMCKAVRDRSARSPRILVPTGTQPDNTFNRNAHPVALLWGIIDEVYPKWEELL